MQNRFPPINRRAGTLLGLATVSVLAGCVTSHRSPPAVAHPMAQAKARYHAARTQIHVSGAVVVGQIRPVETPFQRAVWHLQSLGYLPIVHAAIYGQDGVRTRHDNFLWPVPAALQKAADQYAWNAGNPFIRGAVIQFERANGLLGPKGVSEGRFHKAVLHALFSSKAKSDPWAWEWALVNKAAGTRTPERLSLWTHSQGWHWHTVVNTGVLGSTPDGTWPIYQRLPSTTMRGVFPVPVSSMTYAALEGQQVPQWAGSTLLQSARGVVNGHTVRWQPYNDPGIKWVNYFDDGRGIHYYPRARYGFPQSAGCVEEPLKSARTAYGLLHYGVPVTVAKAAFSASQGSTPSAIEGFPQ
ncbi:L,D-transpeptidase family protein [Acidithiobacillus thiooxidans]|uniref:L,D-transpeptidase family protein n=1 Tax=Acidithiobacillus thiooxidans TaxID=930 RepID=UPI001C07E427|nr:L,D-transpeptidase family protein [Acidithiobacillus thiooxidans]MBU2792806.1 L,D-transpeptidase family protein [Acidithiobacillus thiooxidans]